MRKESPREAKATVVKMFGYNGIAVFSCNSHPALAEEIASHLSLRLGQSEVKTFSDGEISISIGESVRGKDVYVIQSTSSPVNDNLMELLIMLDAMRRASAGRITAVMPYFGYARQDRKAKPRDPISAKLVANLLTVAGADRVLTMDLHAPQIQGFFDIPVDHLQGSPTLSAYFAKRFGANSNLAVVSPDLGSVTRTRIFAQKCDAPIAIIDKRRARANVCEVCNIIGDVKGKTCIIVDDMVDTAGTLCNAAAALIETGGASEVYACATHGVLSGPAIERISASRIKQLILLDTIDIPKEKLIPNIKTLSVSKLFAEAIERIHENLPVSGISFF